MKLIPTTGADQIGQYAHYVHNCLRNAACEPPWAAPLPGLPYLQFYVDFGQYKPVTVQVQLQDMCNTGHTEQIFASNYIIGQTPEGNWYGVFKYFTHPLVPVTNFVVWLSAEVDVLGGLVEQTYFSELLTVEGCLPLTKIKACQPEQATTTGFDMLDVYYGLPVNGDILGNDGIRYFHIAYTRLGKARELPPKGTFTTNLIRNFRTSIDRSWSLECELVPKWYYLELLAILARGAISLNDGPTYLLSDLNMEAINDDDLLWKPFATLKQTTRLYFGCDTSVCVECCSPRILSATSTSCCSPTIVNATADVVEESASASDSSSVAIDDDAQIFINAVNAVGSLSLTEEDAINQLVIDLKDASLWADDKMLALWPIVGGTAATHIYNLKHPTSAFFFRLILSGSWTHGPNGMTGDGSSAYANTQFNPFGEMADDDGAFGLYSRTSAANGSVDMGVLNFLDTFQVVCRAVGDNFFANFGSSTYPSVSNTDGRGLFCTNRKSTTDTEGYKNGALVLSTTQAVTLPNDNVYLGARNNGGGTAGNFSGRQIALAFISRGLTSGEHATLYTIIQAFQTALGRQV